MLTPDEIDILERVVSKKELEPIFFRKIKGLKWFDSLAERDFFDPEKNPQPRASSKEGYINIPNWPVAEYLATTAQEIPYDEPYAAKFLDLLRKITNHAITNNYSNYRTWWKLSEVIKYIPVSMIKLEDMKIVDYWFDDPYENSLVAHELGDNWLPLLLESDDPHSHEVALKLINLIFQLKPIKHEKKKKYLEEFEFVVREYYVKDIAKNIVSKAAAKLNQSIVDLFKTNLETILNQKDNDKWSSVWRPAIEAHEQNKYRENAQDITLEAFRDSLLSWSEVDPKASENYILNLIDNSLETFKRVAIYCISCHFSHLDDLVNRVIVKENFKPNLRHEMWNFLNKNFSELSLAHKSLVKSIVESIIEVDVNEIISEQATAYEKLRWYSAIKDKSPELLNRYSELVEVAGGEPDHPDFSSFMTVGWVGHKSPFSREVILGTSIDDLVVKLNEFEGEKGFDAPCIEGLAKEFKESIKSSPLHFYKSLPKFINSKAYYIHSLISAYSELWAEKKMLPWSDIWPSLLSFCKNVISNPSFWQPIHISDGTSFHANSNWIVGSIGNLIEAGTKSDEHAFDDTLLCEAKEILVIILTNQNGESFHEGEDAVSIAINSPRGQCIEALVNLALRACRLENAATQNHKEAWECFQPLFNKELTLIKEGNYEFSTLVIRYLPNFLYMSNDWVERNLARIFDHSNYLSWLCAMQGYASTNQVYEKIYKFLMGEGYLIKALDDENLKEYSHKKIIQSCVVAYLNDFESLNQPTSLISQILTRRKESELSELIWFFWTLHDSKDEKLNSKIFELWPILIQIIDFDSEEGQKLASKLSTWVTFIQLVDDNNRDYIFKVAPYANIEFNASYLIEAIARISENQPIEAYKIWVKVLESDTPDFPPEELKTALLNINNSGAEGVRHAKEIASKYIAVGNDQLSTWLTSK